MLKWEEKISMLNIFPDPRTRIHLHTRQILSQKTVLPLHIKDMQVTAVYATGHIAALKIKHLMSALSDRTQPQRTTIT